MRLKSDIPFGSQFSPAQIKLDKVLQILSLHGKANAQFTEEIRMNFFRNHANGDHKQQTELAKNVRLSLRSYGIINEDDTISDFGSYLISLIGDYNELILEFAKHIILELNGLQLLRAKKTLESLDEDSDLISLAKELERIGIHVPSSGTHISTAYTKEDRTLLSADCVIILITSHFYIFNSIGKCDTCSRWRILLISRS